MLDLLSLSGGYTRPPTSKFADLDFADLGFSNLDFTDQGSPTKIRRPRLADFLFSPTRYFADSYS